MKTRFFSIILLAAAFSGCATYLNLDLKRSIKQEDTSKVQLFLSTKVTLHRELGIDERGVTPGHSLKIVQGKRIEQVVFPKRCPGVATSSSTADTLWVSFEDGTTDFPNPSLPFELSVGEQPCDLSWGGFCFSRPESNIYNLRDGRQVTYMGKTFTVDVARGANGHLIVDAQWLKQDAKDVRVVTGRHVGQ